MDKERIGERWQEAVQVEQKLCECVADGKYKAKRFLKILNVKDHYNRNDQLQCVKRRCFPTCEGERPLGSSWDQNVDGGYKNIPLRTKR